MKVDQGQVAIVAAVAGVVGTLGTLAGIGVGVFYGNQSHRDALQNKPIPTQPSVTAAEGPSSTPDASPESTPEVSPSHPAGTTLAAKPTAGATPTPTQAGVPAPSLQTVALTTLCYSRGVSMPSQGNCQAGGGQWTFSNGTIQWGLNADTSSDGITWIEFPATSCRSISLDFGEPGDLSDVEPAITAAIEQDGHSRSSQAPPGVIGHLEVDLSGSSWRFSLVSAPVSSDPYNWTVYVSGSAQCSSSDGL